VSYTIVNLYQSVPTTCNQPVPITCDKSIPVINMYQQNPISTRPVYTATHVCTRYVYTASHVCTRPVYTATYVHLLRARFSTFLKLSLFVAFVTSTCNLSLCPICSYGLRKHHHTYPLTKCIFVSLVMCHTCGYNHDQV
jgi:hypothetical protein